MNERIKELADQAKNDLVTEIHSKATGMDINIVKIIVLGSKLKDDYAQGFSTKFAELIVRECARIARNTDLEDVEGGDSAVLRAAGEQIQKHFGVEE